MARYTEEELLQLKPEVEVPVNFDIDSFRAVIDKVKEIQGLQEEEFQHFHRRRSSHNHGKPKIKHLKPKITTDSDGWSTFDNMARRKSSVVAGGSGTINGSDEDAPAKEPVTIAQETLRVKPNKNISSTKPADSRDIVADKATNNFNAFAALESDEEDD
ncbi:LAME_0C04786g1_1 [Lachancea meyersii CBS 8951]|uniref:Cap-associated protein CAF20 n=1 Tax=Lachancea meyersii CBS 8951 TaxID=1266667 RepID=A0A1G4J1W5_9SACH|nr:LAME_0C04786g1_1 [Lachancea meyersii CBS 8951]